MSNPIFGGANVEKTRDKTITLKVEVWKELKRLSVEEEMTLSEVVSLLLRERAARKQKKETR